MEEAQQELKDVYSVKKGRKTKNHACELIMYGTFQLSQVNGHCPGDYTIGSMPDLSLFYKFLFSSLHVNISFNFFS